MPALVPGLQQEGEIDLLRRLHREGCGLALPELAPAGIGIERKIGVQQVPVLLQQGLDAVAGGLLVAGEHDDEVARGDEAFALIANEIRHQHRRARLVVARSSAVVVPVLLPEGEGIERPVLFPGPDHVQVGHEENGLGAAALAPIARDQIGDPGLGLDQPHVVRRKPRARQPLRHGLGREIGVPGGVAGVDLDQLLQDFTLERPGLLLGGENRRGGEKSED